MLSKLCDLLATLLVIRYFCGAIPAFRAKVAIHFIDLKHAIVLLLFLIVTFFPQAMWSKWLRHVFLSFTSNQTLWRLLLITTSMAAFTFSFLQTAALRYPLFDVGIFHQIGWSLSHGHGFWSSISRAGFFLLDHASLDLWMLGPLFTLTHSSAYTLAALHVALLTTGLAAWIWYARQLESSRTLSFMVFLFALGFESLWANLKWGFHETAFAFAAGSWLMVLKLTNRRERLQWLFLLIVALSKETGLLLASSWSFLTALDPKRRPFGRFFSLTLSIIFMLSFLLFEHLPHPADKNYVERYYAYLPGGFDAFQSSIGLSELIRYLGSLAAVIWPVWFVRSFPERRWLLVPLATILATAFASHPPLRSFRFHYVLEIWPFWIPVSIAALSRLKQKRLITFWVFGVWLLTKTDLWYESRVLLKERASYQSLRTFMERIPEHCSVLASDLAGPWVASRAVAARIPDQEFFANACPDVLVRSLNDTPHLEKEWQKVEDRVLKACSSWKRAVWTQEFTGWRIQGTYECHPHR